MKKIILVFVAILSANQFVNAQDKMSNSSYPLDIRFGAKAGLNLATLDGDAEGAKSRTSFHFGAVAEIMIKEDLAIQPELLYSAQGAKLDDSTLAFDYLNVPIMAKYFVKEEFTLEAGPQFGYLLSAKLKDNSSANGGGNTVSPDTTSQRSAAAVGEATVDVKDDLKSFDFGFNIGASYILENGINLSLRYYIGLANANNFEGGDANFKNSVLQFSVGYFFN